MTIKSCIKRALTLRATLSILLLFMLTQTALAWQIAAPMLSLAGDPATHAIRPIWGLRVASSLGAPIELPFTFSQLEISAKQDFAVGIVGETAELVAITNLSSQPAVNDLGYAIKNIDKISLSHSGEFGAWTTTDNELRVVRGIPRGAETQALFDLTGVTDWPVTALAVSNSGETLVAFSNGESGAIYLFTPDGRPRFLSAASQVSAIALYGGMALVADRQAREVLVIHDYARDATVTTLLSSSGLARPAAVQFSDDGRRALIADEEASAAIVVSLDDAAPIYLSCDCHPKRLQALSANGLFAMTNPADGPLILLDIGADSPRFLVVPDGL